MEASSLPLDSLLPGYSLFLRLLHEMLGYDVSRLIPLLALCFALFKTIDYVYYSARNLILRFCTCSIHIGSDVDAYYSMRDWLADKTNFSQRCSELSVLSTPLTTAEPTLGAHFLNSHSGLVSTSRKNGRRRRPQEFEPILDSFQPFWHGNRLFVWYRRRERRQAISPGYEMTTELVQAKIFCFSWTTQPIKALMEEAVSHYDLKHAGMTKIRRPAAKGSRSGEGNPWRTVTMRPSRPLDTVIFDEKVKQSLIEDIEKYLQPESRQWYSDRGIPYRRGYLFHGVPGTGKTSLSFALAGYLDLNIFCVSLAEQSVTEEDLFLLFSHLPEQCIVLLEDIDCAGMKKRGDKANLGAEVETGIDDLSRYSDSTTRVSLSGLLNVIDGVSSQEGRILIMTTNDIAALDQAMLRPGRIDVKIEFGMASKSNAYNLFIQTFMNYSNKSADEKVIPSSLTAQAELFTNQIPEDRFTPAEIQGYLLSWKNNPPEDAVGNVKAWIDEESNNKKSI